MLMTNLKCRVDVSFLNFQTTIKRVCETQMPPEATKTKLIIYGLKVTIKVISYNANWKSFISWVCMLNMKLYLLWFNSYGQG